MTVLDLTEKRIREILKEEIIDSFRGGENLPPELKSRYDKQLEAIKTMSKEDMITVLGQDTLIDALEQEYVLDYLSDLNLTPSKELLEIFL